MLVVNVVGSFVLGMLLGREAERARARVALHDFGAIGFCGGLTTFSTFAVEVVDLVGRGMAATAALYGVASVLGAVAAVLAGAGLVGRVRAVELPVEERP